MKNLRLLPFLVLAATAVPLGFFLLLSNSILKKSFKNSVVNEPQAALAQSLDGLNASYHQALSQTLLAALHFSMKDSLQKALTAPVTETPSVRTVAQDAAQSFPLPFLIVTNKAGKVLFDTLGIPKPTPSATPEASKKKKAKTGKPKEPLYADIHDWPGMDRALSGSSVSGLLAYQGTSYLVSAVPVSSHSKTTGVVLAGAKIDKGFLQNLKSSSPDEVAFYSQGQTLCTSSSPAPLLAPQAGPVSVQWQRASYLAGALTLTGPDGKPAGGAYLAAFQPVKTSLTVEGSPQKQMLEAGLLLMAAATLLALGFLWQFTGAFNQLVKAVDQIRGGNLNTRLPTSRLDELGGMARSLKEMVESLQEKDRISLVLGKVVDPQAAKKILADKDYFALKGERRECTLLQADLKGFNTLSENMAPEALVEALNRYFSLINDAVFKEEGMLDRFIGEAAVAIWGAPFSHEDKEERAVKAALEIQEALREFNISRIKTGHPPFTVGIGIHTGLVVAGNLGSDKHYDYSVIGEPLHVANRLCAMAAPGQTVVSGETYERVRTLVKANAMNPIAIKDSLEPLATFEITQLL